MGGTLTRNGGWLLCESGMDEETVSGVPKNVTSSRQSMAGQKSRRRAAVTTNKIPMINDVTVRPLNAHPSIQVVRRLGV